MSSVVSGEDTCRSGFRWRDARKAVDRLRHDHNGLQECGCEEIRCSPLMPRPGSARPPGRCHSGISQRRRLDEKAGVLVKRGSRVSACPLCPTFELNKWSMACPAMIFSLPFIVAATLDRFVSPLARPAADIDFFVFVFRLRLKGPTYCRMFGAPVPSV